MGLRLFTLIASLALASPAVAGDVAVQLVDQAGKPVADAVVTIRPDAGVPAGPIRFPWAMQLAQQDVMFAPHILIVPVGATVGFPNHDKVRHQVYSFSKAARFEMKLYGRDESRSYVFKSVGAVAVGCNIHDRMSAFILVVDTPYAARTDATGMLRIPGVTAGGATVTVWHERSRGKDNETKAHIDVPAAGVTNRKYSLTLR